jgi:hypothetical protein
MAFLKKSKSAIIGCVFFKQPANPNCRFFQMTAYLINNNKKKNRNATTKPVGNYLTNE